MTGAVFSPAGCHPERSEGSLCPANQTLRGVYPEPIRFAQGKLRAWAQGARHSLRMSNTYQKGLTYRLRFDILVLGSCS